MKKIMVFALLVVVTAACEKKEDQKPGYQFPTGGPVQGQPLQGGDELKLIQEAVQKDPANVNAWIKLGNVMMDTGRFTEAIDAYQKALAIDPKNVDVRVDLGTCYRNAGKPDVAVKEYRKALEFNPNHLNAYKNLGVVLAYDLKDTAQAAKAFEKYLQIAPNAPDAGQVKQEIQKLKGAK